MGKIKALRHTVHLLNIRLVCWKVNEWALEELEGRLQSKLIHLKEDNIKEFNTTVKSLPFKSFRLSFRAAELYVNPEVLKLVENFGFSMESLSVPEFKQWTSTEEVSFYRSLQCLKNLTIHEIPQIRNSLENSITSEESIFPSNCLNSLKSLQISNVVNSFYHLDLIEKLPIMTLEYLQLPSLIQRIEGGKAGFFFTLNWIFPGVMETFGITGDTTNQDTFSLAFDRRSVHERTIKTLVKFLETRGKVKAVCAKPIPALTIDLTRHLFPEDMKEEVRESEVLCLRIIKVQNIKLNVSNEAISYFSSRFKETPNILRDLSGCIESLVGVPLTELLGSQRFQLLQNLKTLSFRSRQTSSPDREEGNVDAWKGSDNFFHPVWPNLRTITGILKIDDKCKSERRITDFRLLYNFLFRSERNDGHLGHLESISLVFTGPVGMWLSASPLNFKRFKSLRRLTLEGVLKGHKFYDLVSFLADDSQKLEELVFKTSEPFCDEMFIKNNLTPPLLKLKCLRRLELTHETITFDNLPWDFSDNLGDRPFKCVFKMMNLSVLKLNGVIGSKVTLQALKEVIDGERMQNSMTCFEFMPQMKFYLDTNLIQGELSARSVFKQITDLVKINRKVIGCE